MVDQFLNECGIFRVIECGIEAGERLGVFPAAVVFRGVDGFAQDGSGVQEGDGFLLFGEPGLQAFVDFQAVVIPVAGIIEREGEFMSGDVVGVADVVTADVPEFNVIFAGDAGCFQEVQVFAENDDAGVRTIDHKAPLQHFRVLGGKLIDF